MSVEEEGVVVIVVFVVEVGGKGLEEVYWHCFDHFLQ